MSSSKAAVFPATKREAVPYCSSWGQWGEEEDRLGQGHGAGVLVRNRRLGGCPGSVGTGSTAQQLCSIWPVLGWARS